MIDWAQVSELRDEIGAEDFSEVVEIFLEEVDGAMADLGRNPADLEAQLHFLKGSALNLGFAAFSTLCQDGESRAAAGDSNVDLGEIRTSYAASRAAFLDGMANRFAA